jgi:hypothetical protein
MINEKSLKNLKVMKPWETANPNWRPRKWVSLFLHNCEEDWIEPIKKQDLEATYLSLINMDWEELKKVWTDEKQTVLVRKLAKFIADAKDIDIFEKMLDRWIWKAKTTEDITIKWKIKQETSEEQKQLITELIKRNNK